MEKKYVGLEGLQAFKDNLDNTFASQAYVTSAITDSLPLKVTLTADGEDFTADKSFTEITTAYNNGRTVFLTYKNGVYPLTLVRTTRVTFELNEETGRKQIQCRHSNDADTWEYTETPQTQADWSETYEDSASYIRNKPFGDFYAIRRTGDETTTVTGKYTTFTLVSTEVLEYEELRSVALYAGSGGSFPSLTYFSDNAYGNYNGILVITQDGTTCSQVSNNPFPKAGVYLSTTVEYAVLQYKKLPEKYIPSKYETTESVQEKIATATADLASKEYVDSKQVQSDWSVNDFTDSAYIQNKPFSSVLDDEVIVLAENLTIPTAKTEVLLSAVNSNKAAFGAAHFIVIYNGSTYELAIDNVAVNGVGDKNLTTYPFYIRVSAAKYWAPEYYLKTADANAVVFVSYQREIVTSIDNKFVAGKPGIIVPQGTQFVYNGIASDHKDKIVTAGENSEIFNSSSLNVVGNSYAHAEGEGTLASGRSSHAEGEGSAATGYASHTEGSETIASDLSAHAEGTRTVASNYASHAEGYQTIAAGMYQHVQGIWNIEDGPTDDHDGQYAHIVGNGNGDDERSNAHTLDWAGNAWFAGEVKIGGTSQDDATAKTLATTEYVDKASGWEILMDVTLEEECVEVIGITLTDAQKARIANGGDFVCYAECPPPTTTASAGWICGGLWANNMYYFILSGFGQPSGIVPSSTDTHTSKIYCNLKNASGDMRIRDMLYTTSGTPHQLVDFMDASEYMTHYRTQPLTVRFKTNGKFAAGTRLVCKVR